MSDSTWRLVGWIAAGLLLGLAFGYPGLGVAAALAACLYFLLRDLRRALLWIRERREEPPPDLGGSPGELLAEMDRLRQHFRQREERLTQMLKRFQEAASALPDAIVILTHDHRIDWVNQRATDYLGIRWPQDAGQRLANLIRHPRLLEYLNEQGQSGDTHGVTLPSPEDPRLQLEFRVMPYGDNLRLLVARDVSQLQQINQMRRDFIANASHELRTPLTVIAGYLEAMEGDLDSNGADLQPQIRQMRRQANRMQTLIEDLLMLSSLESGGHELQKETVAVAEILTGIYKEATTLSGERNHMIVLEVDHDLLLAGSPNELYSAFSNLVVNAVLYTPPGGVIRIRWYADDSGAHMKVSDTGDGIAPEHIPRLTERFYRVDKGRSRESGGTGLGLAIVKHVMQRHRGALHIESELGKGSIFRCDFPPELIVHSHEHERGSGRQRNNG